MSCFTGCMGRTMPKQQNYVINRSTSLPMNFAANQIQELRKRFMKVSNYRDFITLEAFKKNMGVLGLHCSQQFSVRLFNAFDLDNDNKIDFHDFLQYMYILKGKNDNLKAKISFKMIVPPQTSVITKDIFKKFLNDFFVSWSFVTNIDITTEIRERTDQYTQFLFKKVEKETGKPQINLKYYTQQLYKDKDYSQSFEFITQGMADIFISEKKKNDPEAMLYKIIKQIYEIKETVFDMSNQQSAIYQPIRYEESVTKLPTFSNALFKPDRTNKIEMKKSKDCTSNKTRHSHNFNEEKKHIDHSDTNTHSNFGGEDRKGQLLYESSKVAALQKKLKYIEDKINKIVSETKGIYQTIKKKMENDQFKSKNKQKTFQNVHKRIKKAEGQMVFIGDDNWNMVLNMMIGIQMAVRSVKGLQQIICEEPKDFNLKYCFELIPRRFGDDNNHATIYSFTDYAPNTFNHIRKIFQIDNQEYINSIGPNKLMASLMMGQVSSMTSLTSQGKSGSFFYYTADGKYMLKTIQYRQYRFLRTILEDYYYYIKKNKDTLITKFFGLHKLIEKDDKGQQIDRSYFVIMANVFNTRQKIVQRFDIKGSWYGRQTTDNDPSATKKDNDFKKRDPIKLPEQYRRRLVDIIRRDAEFFERHQIIDYSLLIGVIRKTDTLTQSQPSERQHQSRILQHQLDFEPKESKIFYGHGNGQVTESYIFGIIDILTLYDSRKVMQYYFKRLVYGQGISAVPPADYAARFVNFIQNTVFGDQGSKIKKK